MTDWIAKLFQNHDMTRMGHCQRVADHNLGLGWIYYGLARVIRPATVAVIGSFRGFVPLMFAKALADNAEKGQVVFIDPSLVDDFWKDPAAVRAHFASLGANNIRHFLMTTQQFVESEAYRSLGPVGIVFVDGYHSADQARFDYEAFRDRLTPDGIVLFHDSILLKKTTVYGPARAYQHRVKDYIDTLKKDASLQVFDLPFGQGVTLVRKALLPGEERPQ
jgi:predicted O-methyltransferase YrrM